MFSNSLLDNLTFPNPCYINPVVSLHGKLTVTAKLAPGCPARPCGLRRPDAALAPGALSPRPTHRRLPPPAIKPNQTKSNHVVPFEGRDGPVTMVIDIGWLAIRQGGRSPGPRQKPL